MGQLGLLWSSVIARSHDEAYGISCQSRQIRESVTDHVPVQWEEEQTSGSSMGRHLRVRAALLASIPPLGMPDDCIAPQECPSCILSEVCEMFIELTDV